MARMSELARGLREEVCRANIELTARGLVTGTFGNVSAVDRAAGLFAIKASGVPYDGLTWEQIVPVSLETGLPLETSWRPSSDTPTHRELYLGFPCGGIAHTHSDFATAFAQAVTAIRCTGTTHADYFRGDIPVTRSLQPQEIERDYERHTGLVIVDTFKSQGLSPEQMPGVLVAHHGPFTWGRDAHAAVELAHALETIARIECIRRLIAGDAPGPAAFLIDKHFLRKHGSGAYYGQKT
jgi:L-ribulose-5-phosphate 4-epimerase